MGAGFAIAMRDLEIRGAGNILGTRAERAHRRGRLRAVLRPAGAGRAAAEAAAAEDVDRGRRRPARRGLHPPRLRARHAAEDRPVPAAGPRLHAARNWTISRRSWSTVLARRRRWCEHCSGLAELRIAAHRWQITVDPPGRPIRGLRLPSEPADPSSWRPKAGGGCGWSTAGAPICRLDGEAATPEAICQRSEIAVAARSDKLAIILAHRHRALRFLELRGGPPWLLKTSCNSREPRSSLGIPFPGAILVQRRNWPVQAAAVVLMLAVAWPRLQPCGRLFAPECGNGDTAVSAPSSGSPYPAAILGRCRPLPRSRAIGPPPVVAGGPPLPSGPVMHRRPSQPAPTAAFPAPAAAAEAKPRRAHPAVGACYGPNLILSNTCSPDSMNCWNATRTSFSRTNT